MVNYFHINAERMSYSKAGQLLEQARELTEVITCYMDPVMSNYVHIVFTGNQSTADQVKAIVHQLNGGNHCEVNTITEQQLDDHFV